MERVGRFLQIEAHKKLPSQEGDLFGRSAYNRYYYAVFLTTRELVRKTRPGKRKLGHADYPGYLKGEVQKSIKNGRRTAQQIGDSDLIGVCNRALSAINDLASLMDKGRAVRLVADYQPDITIQVTEGTRYKLNGVSITDADNWPTQASQYCNTIEAAWSQINV